MKTDIITNNHAIPVTLIPCLHEQTEIQIHNIYHSLPDALIKFRKQLPELLIIYSTHDKLEIEQIKNLKLFSPATKVLVIISDKDRDFAFKLLKSGADGILQNDMSLEEIVSKLKKVPSGGIALSEEIIKWIIERNRNIYYSFLTLRENEILNLLVEGKTNGQISSELYISPFTIKTHISNIYSKIGCNKKSELLDKVKNRRNQLQSV